MWHNHLSIAVPDIRSHFIGVFETSLMSHVATLHFLPNGSNVLRWPVEITAISRRCYLSAAGISSLYWRAPHRAVGAIYTAVPRLGFQYLVTGVTFIKPLASIGRHDLQFLVATARANNLWFGKDFCHLAASGIGHCLFAGHIKSATDTVSIRPRAP